MNGVGENPLSAQYDVVKIDLQPSEQYKSVSEFEYYFRKWILLLFYIIRWYWLDSDLRLLWRYVPEQCLSGRTRYGRHSNGMMYGF